LISNMTGLQFSYIKTGSYTEALKKITNYEADILTGIDSDVHWASQHNLTLTDSYLSASIVLVKNVKVQNLKTATTALVKNYLAATEYVRKSSPDANIIYYDTPLACFEAVNRGDADITYANSYVAEKLLENPKLNKLAIVETVNLSDQLCIGISDSIDPILLSILNKSIHSITDTQLNGIIFEHAISDKPVIDLEYLLYKNPNYFFTILVALFLVTTLTMVIIIMTKNYHNEEIKKVAYLDSVTGTWNYNKFKVDAQALLKSAKNKEYAIVYIDIYNFSYINDTFGYYTGDIILAEVAKEMESTGRESECSARISADNFVCLLEYESDDAMIKRGLAFQNQCDERLCGINSRFKVQFTSAIYKVSQGEADIPSLVGKAEIAHKTISVNHKSSVIFYNDKIQNDYLRKKKLESAMSASLGHGDFLVYLQPKVDLVSNKIVGTEALARWQHPTEGLILPKQFISLFESNGFILELDFYIYEKVCQLLRKWLDAGESVMPVSVNVSKAHLANQQFGAQLKALIEEYQITPDLLELELTESILFDNAQEAFSMIQDLKNLGFSILIDDFGSGYSSLNVLKDLTVDILKLDKEFFRKGGMAEKDKIIVDGIIRIANDLNLRIISEGVETQEQVDFLVSAGCHMAQGYFFAKPMPVEDFERLFGYQC
ncbi:MAG TPA: EAL domain-containing protein, partial [Anaerovoracaceae bacterium]|nr:EAL domain-containing protein [Anaerovoracaceae bacterium]